MSPAVVQALTELRKRRALPSGPLGLGLDDAGVNFVALGADGDASVMQRRWDAGWRDLACCVKRVGWQEDPILCEGGVYNGAWIEGTGTISCEVLDRFAPQISANTQLRFAAAQRSDRLIPYKVIDSGPGFGQIQIVSPFARSVWRHYLAAGRDETYLRTMYDSLLRMDGWLEQFRDTRGTGGVEAFCTFDTGHDLSPRFWHAPERCYQNDATHVDPHVPWLPYVAPDLTANVACQRFYLAKMLQELGGDPQPWLDKAQASIHALWQQCWDGGDEMFYDRTADGDLLKVKSDVLLRVLECEIGDDDFFERELRRYVLNTREFLSGYGFTSVAMSDPRFDSDYTRNSWAGPVNFLCVLRAPEAFDLHGHVAELAYVWAPLISAVSTWDRFPQCVDAWSGDAGYTECYSPSILWYLDAIERTFGILPRPEGDVWLTAQQPATLEGPAAAAAVGYSRTISGTVYELIVDPDTAYVQRDGNEWLTFPAGLRAIVDARSELTGVVNCAATQVTGNLEMHSADASAVMSLSLAPNERAEITNGHISTTTAVSFIPPQW